MEKIPLTKAGFAKLDAELKELKSVRRPAVIKAIAEASHIEGRIQELEGIIGRADVIDVSRMSGAIKFGATVKLVDEDTDEEKTYQIVGEAEADIENGKLNVKSPLARALIGKEEGDSGEVKTPGGTRDYEILEISYI